MRSLKPLLLFAILVVGGCASTTSGISDSFEKQFRISAPVTNPIVIGNMQIPLPEGNWVVASSQTERSSTNNTPMVGVIVFNLDEPAEAMAVEITTNIEPASYSGWVPLPACSRKDMLSPSPTSSYAPGDEECWFVNHTRLTRNEKTSKLRRNALDFARGRNLKAPVNALYVGYRIADAQDFFTVRYFFNPEAKNLAPPQYADWRTSDWHRDRIQNFPKKYAYFKTTQQWGAAWLSKMKAGFRGKLAMPTSHNAPSKLVKPVSSKPETRLKQLDSLLEKGLITPREHKERRKKIIEEL